MFASATESGYGLRQSASAPNPQSTCAACSNPKALSAAKTGRCGGSVRPKRHLAAFLFALPRSERDACERPPLFKPPKCHWRLRLHCSLKRSLH